MGKFKGNRAKEEFKRKNELGKKKKKRKEEENFEEKMSRKKEINIDVEKIKKRAHSENDQVQMSLNESESSQSSLEFVPQKTNFTFDFEPKEKIQFLNKKIKSEGKKTKKIKKKNQFFEEKPCISKSFSSPKKKNVKDFKEKKPQKESEYDSKKMKNISEKDEKITFKQIFPSPSKENAYGNALPNYKSIQKSAHKNNEQKSQAKYSKVNQKVKVKDSFFSNKNESFCETTFGKNQKLPFFPENNSIFEPFDSKNHSFSPNKNLLKDFSKAKSPSPFFHQKKHSISSKNKANSKEPDLLSYAIRADFLKKKYKAFSFFFSQKTFKTKWNPEKATISSGNFPSFLK